MRVPILLWGDLLEGSRSIIRRSLVGERAHECMYAWVYLTEFLAVRRLLGVDKSLYANKAEEKSVVADFDNKIWEILNRKEVDPRSQLNKSGFETVALLNALVHSWSSSETYPMIVELGQTFFAAIDKFQFIYELSKSRFSINYSPEQLRWVGIDNSEFCNTTAKLLHERASQNIRIYKDWKDFKRGGSAIFHSRFVCSYAFKNTRSFADFICANFDAAIIEDAFSTTRDEQQVHNHGQEEVFFDLTLFNQKLQEQNFETYLLSSYGDWPAGSKPCLVVKLLVLKKGSIQAEPFEKFLAFHGFSMDMKDWAQGDLLHHLMSGISSSDWKKICKNKKINPVWGKTDLSKMSNARRLLRYLRDKAKIFASGYRGYNLKGRNAEQEIIRYIADGE